MFLTFFFVSPFFIAKNYRKGNVMADEKTKTPEEPKIPKGLLDATKKVIIENNGTINGLRDAMSQENNAKKRDGYKSAIDKVTADINALSEKEISIEKSSKGDGGTVYIVHAGKFGIRKVVI